MSPSSRSPGERLTRNDVLLCSQEVAYRIFLQMRVVLLEIIGKSESHDGEPGVVVGAVFA